MASLTSVVGVGGSSLTLLSESIGVGEVLLVLGFPGLINGVICALGSTRRSQGYANCWPPMARAMVVMMYHAAMNSAMIPGIDILLRAICTSIECFDW